MEKREIVRQLQETDKMLREYKEERHELSLAARNINDTIRALYADRNRLISELAR